MVAGRSPDRAFGLAPPLGFFCVPLFVFWLVSFSFNVFVLFGSGVQEAGLQTLFSQADVVTRSAEWACPSQPLAKHAQS